MKTPTLKLKKLECLLKELDSVLVAFSGGVDSTFLLKVCKDVLGKKVIAVTAKSESYPESELKKARALAKKIRVRHLIIKSKEMEIKEFKNNNLDRCYHCKKELFSKLKKIAAKHKIKNILVANNYDDIDDNRPGMKAASEMGIVSPLIDVKLTKKEIRILSKRLNLQTYNKPSYACLASRLLYNTKITKEKLKVVGKSEEFLRKFGISQVRVRHHGNIARIEVEKKDFHLLIKNSENVSNHLKKLGFDYITMDLQGYRTGSMNYGH